ncbi:helix-turn-helix domain-containing protein [Niallia sp. XMNu-256]|uniref:helix-turn-helix domain-containing protein n=1 Tax=Niallia sp. XMNu-256 TaxID=3082444 RepID=UPI0030D0C4F6
MKQEELIISNNESVLSYPIWILSSTDEWVHLGQVPPTELEETLFSKEYIWPSHLNCNDYSTSYYPQTGSQLFQFATEVPESTTVRACVHSGSTLSQPECDYFVLKVRYFLLQQTLDRYWQENDTWLEGLHSLTSMLDLDELLNNIVQNVLISIPTVDRGFLMLYDTETQKLTTKASFGLGSTIYDFKTDIGEGVGGKVFEDGIGRIFTTEQGLEAMSNVQEHNMRNLLTAMGVKVITNTIAMAVPVRMNKEKIGVMIVHQVTKKRKLTHEDLRRLQGFADQAAIAITNARFFSELKETNEYLMKRNHIHEAFTKLSLKDSDLIMIAKTVEKMINLPVSLFDISKNEWYPHYAPLSKKLMNTNFFNDWEDSVDSLTVTIDETPIHLYPIVNEGIPIGYFVVELNEASPLSPIDTVVLEQGSALVALKMVNAYSLTDMYYKQCYEFFNELLQYKEPTVLASKSRDFGLSPDQPFFIAVMQLSGKAQVATKLETYQRKLIAALHRELASFQYLLFGFQDKVTILVNVSSESAQELVIEKLENVEKSWSDKVAPTLIGGIGRLYQGLESVARSFEEANKSLAHLATRQTSGMMSFERIGINRLFINQQAEEIKQFTQEVFAPLQSPKALSSDLELTLRTYVAANRSIPETAQQLHIHQNTLYHRIRKIEEILDVDLNDSEDWLKLLLACHLSELY